MYRISLILLSLMLAVGCVSRMPAPDKPTTRAPEPPVETSPEAPNPPAEAKDQGTVEDTKNATQTEPDIEDEPGGYYKDDGPENNPPTNIESIPEPTPKVEPLSKYGNSSYVALGQRFTPMRGYQPYQKTGFASWYGKRFHGKKTSSGEIYDMYALTAAHPILPIPSFARVTNLANGRSIVVRVNDRGPFKKDRLIDLSYSAAYKLGYINHGTAQVSVEAINPSQAPATKLAREKTISGAPTSGYSVQLGAFNAQSKAEQFIAKTQADAKTKLGAELGANGANKLVSVYNNGLYKVRLVNFNSRQQAEKAADELRHNLQLTPLVINP